MATLGIDSRKLIGWEEYGKTGTERTTERWEPLPILSEPSYGNVDGYDVRIVVLFVTNRRRQMAQYA